MIETKMFGTFQVGETVTAETTHLLRKKTYITGEVVGVREHMGKEYLIIKPKGSDAVDVSLAYIDRIIRGTAPQSAGTQTASEVEKTKYTRV